MAEIELREVAEGVVAAYPVVDAVDGTLCDAPIVLHAVAVDVVVDAVCIVAVLVGDIAVVVVGCYALVAVEFVGHQHRTLCHGLRDRIVHRVTLEVRDWEGMHPVRPALTHPDNGGLGHGGAALRPLGALVLVLVLLLAADKGLVDLDHAFEHGDEFVGQDFTHTVEDEPCGLLGDAKLAGEFVGGDAFLEVAKEVHRHEPRVKAEIGTLEDRAVLDGELLAASGAFVGLAVLEAHDLVVVAMGARRFAAFPAHVYEEVRASLLVREAAHELHDTLEFGG